METRHFCRVYTVDSRREEERVIIDVQGTKAWNSLKVEELAQNQAQNSFKF